MDWLFGAHCKMRFICKYSIFAIPVNDCMFIGLTAKFGCSQNKNENIKDIHLNEMQYKDLLVFSEQKQFKKNRENVLETI